MITKDYENKKVLIFGLGLLGGGFEAAKWFYKNGAILRITDLKKHKDLRPTIEKLEAFIQKFKNKKRKLRKKIKYILGRHRKEDIDWADTIYVNPGVSYKNEFVKYALGKNKEVVNDCYLFFKYAKGDIIAITGTRGKTTTTTWIYELLKNANICELLRELIRTSSFDANLCELKGELDTKLYGFETDLHEFVRTTHKPHANQYELNRENIFLGGNQPDKSLFKILNKTSKDSISVLELSSFQLEFYKKNKNLKAPKIAIITCLLRDHLNRYNNMEEYAKAKANIFMNQTSDDYLILNYDNKWTKFFLKLKPNSQVYFVSLKPLPKNLKGIFIKNNTLIIRDEKDFKFVSSKNNFHINPRLVRISSRLSSYKFAYIKKFKEIYGEHNLYNLLFAVLAIYLYFKDKGLKNINKLKKYLKKEIFKLQTPPFRQEIIYQSKNLTIINDSAATTPDATIAAIRRFYNIREFMQNICESMQTICKPVRNKFKAEHVLILITGGTDKNLDFKELAKEIKKKIKPENLYLLNGSATKKLIGELKRLKYKIKEENIFENLKDIISKIFNQYSSVKNPYKSVITKTFNPHISVQNPCQSVLILFSPASASFEKFKNEFDRGEQFNKLIKQFLRQA